MNIVVVSAFRNMSGRVNRYFQQVHALATHVGPDHPVRVVAVEGDSVDETERELVSLGKLWQIPTTVVRHDHGKKVFGSTEEPERIEALSGVLAAGMGGVEKSDDVVVYVESDLVWKPHDVGSLIDIAFERRAKLDVVAPLVFAGDAFYDIWGFRGTDGSRFGPFAPYHPCLESGEPLVEIGSAGSCLVMRADVARTVDSSKNREALVGWCGLARKKKFRIGVAVDFRVDHP